MGTLQIQLHSQFGDAVRVFRQWGCILPHGELVGAINCDAGGEDKALHCACIDRCIDQVDASDEVVLVIEASDEVAQTFSSIGCEVKDVFKLMLFEQRLTKLHIVDAALHEGGDRMHIVGKAA